MKQQSGIKQLLNVFVGTLVMSGYFLYESILFGAMFWLGWNMCVATYAGLDYMTYFQAVGIIFIIKLIKFDSGRMNIPTAIVPRETNPKTESAKSAE